MDFLFNFFKLGMSFLLANQLFIFLKNNYPDDYNNYLMSISYNIIFIYSKAQLIIMKINKCILNNMDSLKKNYPELSNLFLSFCKNNNYVEFIKHGEIFLKINLDNISKINTSIYNFDFILLTNFDDECNNKNKSIYYYLPDDDDISINEKSNVTFILVEIMIQNSTIVVHFKNDIYNYLIDGNIFDYYFLIYFLKTHYKHEYEKLDSDHLNEKDVKMRIMDGNINNYEFDMSNKIKINKNDFQIIKNQEEEEKDLLREIVMNNKDNFLNTDDFIESLNTKISTSFDFNNNDTNEMVNEITNENCKTAEPKIRKYSETEYECL
jgi:hypothetical protein